MTSKNERKSTKWTVGITDFFKPPADIEQKAFPEAQFCFLSDWKKSKKSMEKWREVDALLIWHWNTDRATIELLNNCKIAVRYGVGFDNVDVKALNERNIIFCNNPGCSTTEVADTTCAMILSLQRKIVEYDRRCRTNTGKWQKTLPPIQRTSEQTLGIIGAGRIGKAVLDRMKSFGYRILVYDPYLAQQGQKDGSYELVNSMPEMLCESDIITIHTPLTEETRGMVNAEFFRQMKHGSSFVNNARGNILKDLDCLYGALKNGHLASAAMDVLPDEPPKDHPLIQDWKKDAPWLSGRLLINPHVADYSERMAHDMRFKAAETLRLYFLKGKLRNKIEP